MSHKAGRILPHRDGAGEMISRMRRMAEREVVPNPESFNPNAYYRYA